MTLPYFSAYTVADVIRHGEANEACLARLLVDGVSIAMREAAIGNNFEQFGYLRSWLTTVAVA